MKKILIIIFTIAIFITGGIFGYKKIVSDERERKVIQMFNKDALNNFVENKKSVIERLKTSTPEEANKIYNDYFEISQLIIENINIEHMDLINNIYNEDSEYNFTETDWKIANKYLKDYDLRLVDIGEGDVMINQVPNFYYNIFKDYVTDDYREFLEITSNQDEESYYTDGSGVSYNKIADRLLSWENFLKKYPNSDLAEKANEECNTYRRIYILGFDDVPTREGGWENNELFYIPENNLKEFNRFIEKYPDSPTVELIKFYLENYKNIDADTMLNEKIDKEFYLGGIENREKGNLLSKDSNDLLEKFNNDKEEVIKKLKTSNKEEANKIYENYVESNDEILEKINEVNYEVLDSAFYIGEGGLDKDKLDKQNKFLDSYGLEIVGIEDGIMIREKKDFYYNIFKDFVTDDYREYLKLRSEDVDYIDYSDSFDEYIRLIADKIVLYENFLEKYPDSNYREAINNIYQASRADYIVGLTSSSTREALINGKPNKDVNELNSFIKKYPNSPTTEIIKYYLENYKDEDINKIISEKLNENTKGE